MNQGSKTIWLVIGGIGLFLVLLAFGFQISNISLNLGPVSVGMEKPTDVSALQNEPSQPEQNIQQPPVEQQTSQPPVQTDFNPLLSLPFSDNFDSSISREWRVVSGNYLISNGRLAGADAVTLQIGNNSLDNYVVEFNVSGAPDFCTWGYNNYLIISVTPTLQYRAGYTDLSGRGWWYAKQDGAWPEIARDEIGLGCEGLVSVLVSGNSYSIYANGSLVSQITYGNSAGAPFGIGTGKYPQIDNLVIREP